jgi:hypothetical protein
VAFTGGGSARIGPLHLSAHSLKAPLIIGIVCGLFAALATYRSVPTPRHRGVWFVLPLVCLTIGVNILLQAQPAPPPGVPACLFDYPQREGFRFFLNCDSPGFLGLAKNPSLVFDSPVRQSRPLSFGIPYVLSKPFTLLPFFTAVPIGPTFQATFFGFMVMNVGALTVALVLFARLLEDVTGVPAGPELLIALVIVGANDLTKLFLWTPHTQIFNVLVPCLTMYLSYRLFMRGRPLGSRESIALGLGLGLGLLTYGSFAVPIACVLFIQAVTYRRPWPSLLVLVFAFAPYATWASLVKWHLGEFHNYEMEEYRQFIWMMDCARTGIGSCGPAAARHLTTFFNTAMPVVAIPCVLALVCRLARTSAAADAPATPALQALTRSIALTFVMSLVFFGLMGFYAPRLCWVLVPPVIMTAALDCQMVRVAKPVRWPWLLDTALVCSCMAYLLILAGRAGPYD